METAKSSIIKFPSPRAKTAKRLRQEDSLKYFNHTQIRMLRRAARDQAELDSKKGKKTGIREWMAIDLLISTGLRVSEAADLKCGDLKLGYGESKIIVNEGKGNITAHVVINESLKKHLKHFLSWKEEMGEPIGIDDPLFLGQRGQWIAQAIQQIVKKYLKALKLYEPGKSVHALRHSYGVELYSKEKDLRTVQKQLRHLSIQSTLIYADVTDESISKQIKGLWQ
ncbi:MAG: tyrosine-type recombinase/integrase [Syntrophales bacterium]